MKRLTVFLLVCFYFLNSNAQEEKNFSLAYVGERINGIYIFVLSEPAQKYEYIATVDVDMNWTGTLSENFEKAIKKAKKKHPYFNGLIFQKKDLSKADLIKFIDLDISKGGVKLNGKVSFIEKNKLCVGEVVELQKDKASVKLSDGKIKKIEYDKLTNISDEKYNEYSE